MRIWTGFIGGFVSRPINRKLCDDWRSQREKLPGKTRPLGIPSVYDRVCQQALVNRLEPIFEKVLLIRVALGIVKAASRPTPWVRSGVKWGPATSGSSMRIY